jgi:hypothetical protein
MRAMVKKTKPLCGRRQKTWPGDLGQPIVVPFPDLNKPLYPWEGTAKCLDKLCRLADHYGIERKGDPGWGFLLAMEIARDLHPGFEFVYDDWRATVFKTAYGFTPAFRTKESDNPSHRPKGTGWAPDFPPEFIALFVDGLIDNTLTDKQMCESIAIAIDPPLKNLRQRAELKKKTAILIRRLSEGRKRLKHKTQAGSK